MVIVNKLNQTHRPNVVALSPTLSVSDDISSQYAVWFRRHRPPQIHVVRPSTNHTKRYYATRDYNTISNCTAIKPVEISVNFVDHRTKRDYYAQR